MATGAVEKINAFCGICSGRRTGQCARCGAAACKTCQRCYGCGRLICTACDRAPTPRFPCVSSVAGDHPHSGAAKPVPAREPNKDNVIDMLEWRDQARRLLEGLGERGGH